MNLMEYTVWQVPHCGDGGVVFFFPCRNLLELTNFNSLETEACPTCRGKLIGVLSACSLIAVVECFHACALELWAKHSYCPL